MKKTITIVSIIAVVFLLNSVLVAQGNQNINREQFENAFNRTESVLEMARERIQNSFTKSGMVILKVAEELQTRAQNNGNSAHYVMGAALTMKARERAVEAMAQNKRDEEGLRLVQRQLEKTDELILKVQGRINQNSPETAVRFFDTARENQNRSWELFHRSQYKAALKLSRKTEKTIKNIISRVQSNEGENRRLLNQIQQLEQRFERFEANIADCGNEEAVRLMERARQSFSECQTLAEKGHLKRAETLLDKARNMASKANRICSNTDNLESELNRLRNQVEMMLENASNNSNKKAKQLLINAQNQLQKAEKSCDNNETEECAAYIKTAQMNMKKANRLMEP